MSARLPLQPLEWIDRGQTVNFRFEGKKFKGLAGDTITSALLANKQLHLGRSFKYHRLRGPLSLANHDVNMMAQSGTETNIRGDVTNITEGMEIWATNTDGGLARDRNRIMQYIAKILPVGFYYKAFFKPRFLFPFWERLIRKKAGLGKVSLNWPPKREPKRYGFCDVLVIGAGPSGMAAAVTAAEAGAQVMLVDENPYPGGSLDYQYRNEATANSLREGLIEKIRKLENIELQLEAQVTGWYTDHWLPVASRHGIIKVRSKAVVVASGVFEQPAVFHNNDIPGVMLASAVQRAINRYAVKPCEHAAMVVANEEGYCAALDLLQAGIRVVVIADLNQSSERGQLAEQVKAKGIIVLDNSAIYAVGSHKGRVQSVTVCGLDGMGQCNPDSARKFNCDGVLMSVGWAPAAAVLYQSGCEMSYNEAAHQIVPQRLRPGMYACGRVNGVFDLNAQIADGQAAGSQAVAHIRAERSDVSRMATCSARSHPYPIFDHPKTKNFVDFDEDIQVHDLVNAASEGFDNIELMKRFSTIGMGPSQGKHSNMNGIRILSRVLRQGIDETGSTTARPMFHPVTLNQLAGRRFRPQRLTALHDFHISRKAVMMEAGTWLRPEYYDSGDSRLEAIHLEVASVRNAVGLIDVSTLGKIEAFGPDAAELMDRLYTMRMSNMKTGMTRYALMVDESGVISDDGVAVRLGHDHFYFTTTTSTSASAFSHIQRHILEWNLDVTVVNRTAQLAAMNLAGPMAREVLQPLTDVDLSEQSFPYLAARTGKVSGYDATLVRVGFVGELGYEIHLQYRDARAVWDKLMEAGEAHGIRPFGVEAQRLLRLEKSHIIVGQDTDGLTNPYEANLAWAVHLNKPFFLGQRTLQISRTRFKRQLQGFKLPINYSGPELKECHLIIKEGEGKNGGKDGDIHGRVTSVGFSPGLNRFIGLAFIDSVNSQPGDKIQIRADDGTLVSAELAVTPFYDPDGARQMTDLTPPIQESSK